MRPSTPEPVTFDAPDGYRLAGHCWQHHEPTAPVVVINAATSAHSRYYARFADYLNQSGFHVVTFDYRGIGLSRHEPLQSLQAGWLDWGELDVEAALQYSQKRFAGSQLHCVGHSIGGVLVGMAPTAQSLSRIVLAGAQHAYWPDYLATKRTMMRLRWHVVMPALTALFGYFPGKRLGWLEDTPAGVVRDWHAATADFIDTFANGRGSRTLSTPALAALRARFEAVQAPILVLTSSDDPFATPQATERMLRLFSAAQIDQVTLEPLTLGLTDIGHFGYFHSRLHAGLWPQISDWLHRQA